MQVRNSTRPWIFAAVGAVVLAFMGWWLAPVLTPFATAALLAYLLHPMVDALSRRFPASWLRPLWVILVMLLFGVILVGFVTLIVPVFIAEWPRLQAQLPELVARLRQALLPLAGELGIPLEWDLVALKQFIRDNLDVSLQGGLQSSLQSLRLGGSVALALLGNAVLIPVALFFFLLDGRQIFDYVLSWVPRPMRTTVTGFLSESDEMLGHYLSGQWRVMMALALYYTVALWLAGLSLALPIGVFTGLAVFIPYLGFGLGLVLALLTALLEFAPLQALLMVGVVYGLGQVIEGFFLTPRWVGSRIGLHPLGVIFALLAFGQALGFVGILLALPMSAVLVVAVRRLRANLEQGHWLGRD